MRSSHSSWAARPRVVMLAVALLLALGLGTWALARTTADVGRSDKPLFSYVTAHELVLARADATIARVPIETAVGGAPPLVVWTTSGSHAAVLQGAGRHTRLVSIDAVDGTVATKSCPDCTDLARVGTGTVVTLVRADSGTSLLEFDLAGEGRGTPSTIRPDFAESARNVFLAAGTQDALLATEELDQGASTGRRLKLFPRTGPVRVLGTFAAKRLVAAAIDAGPAAGRIGVAFVPENDQCAVRTPVSIIGTDGHLSWLDMSPMAPPARTLGRDAGIAVEDLWWGRDGSMRATVTSWSCEGGSLPRDQHRVLYAKSILWRLDAAGWQRDSAEGTVRELGVGDRLSLVRAACPMPGCFAAGTLYRERDGVRTTLASDVVAVSAPPPAVVPPSAGVPPDIDSLTRLAGCDRTCAVTGVVTLDHPTFGRTTLASFAAANDSGPAILAAVDSRFIVRWRMDVSNLTRRLAPLGHDRGRPVPEGAVPATVPVDAAGHVFFNLDTGGQNLVVVLEATPDGFETFGSVPGDGEFGAKFYGAEAVDRGDGIYDIVQTAIACSPACDPANTVMVRYRWNGTTFVLVR